MKTFPALLLCLLPLAGFAQDRCAHSQPRELLLDTAGAKRVMFDIGPHRLRLRGAEDGTHRIAGRACASSEGDLARLKMSQEQRGDTLHVTLERENRRGISFGERYAYLEIEGTVPAGLLVQLRVGSGDARLDNAAAVSADIGSGDVELHAIAGQVTVRVGSGDLDVQDAGALQVLSLGSGDIVARKVRGAVEIERIGSGDFELAGTGGDVRIGAIGSGDAELTDIGGNVEVRSLGSGDLDVRQVRGTLTVQSVGSGDVGHRDVTGTVSLPRKR